MSEHLREVDKKSFNLKARYNRVCGDPFTLLIHREAAAASDQTAAYGPEAVGIYICDTWCE